MNTTKEQREELRGLLALGPLCDNDPCKVRTVDSGCSCALLHALLEDAERLEDVERDNTDLRRLIHNSTAENVCALEARCATLRRLLDVAVGALDECRNRLSCIQHPTTMDVLAVDDAAAAILSIREQMETDNG